MHRSLVVAFSALLATACSSTDQTTAAPLASVPPPTTTQTASADTSTPPTVAPATRPAPASGTERLAFDLNLRGNKGKTVQATLDLPASLGIEMDDWGGVIVATCRASSAMGAADMKSFWMRMRGVRLGASPCSEGKSPRACLSQALEADEGEGEVKWTGDTFAERFGTYSSKGGNKFEGTVAMYDAAANAVIVCGYDLAEEAERYREGYQSICQSLGAASTTDKKATARNATMTAAEREDLQGIPEPEKLKSTVEGFYVALGKRDLAAAKKLLLGPDDCKVLLDKAPPDKKKMGLSGCKKEMKEGVDSLTMEVAKEYPENFELGAIRLARGDGMARLKPDADKLVYEVLVTQKGKECTVEQPIFVGKFGDDYRILVARKAKEDVKGNQKQPAEKKPKPKPKP